MVYRQSNAGVAGAEPLWKRAGEKGEEGTMQLKRDKPYLHPWQSVIAAIAVLLLSLATSGIPIYAQSGYIWQHTVVDSAGPVGQHASLALTSSGSPCTSYFSGSDGGSLKYTCQTGSTWQSEIVDSGHVGWSTSLAMDAADHPHISYYNYSAGSVKYAYYDGTAWHTETVEGYGGRFGEFNDLALDAAGHPHIAYTGAGTNWQVLKYAYYDGSTWHKETVDGLGDADVGSYVSLALDADGHPHLSYQDDTNLDLRYAYYDGSTWHTEMVERVWIVAAYPSLALDGASHMAGISACTIALADLSTPLTTAQPGRPRQWTRAQTSSLPSSPWHWMLTISHTSLTARTRTTISDTSTAFHAPL